jgi:hypothetical protein
LDRQVQDPTTVACGALFSERCRSMSHFSTSVSWRVAFVAQDELFKQIRPADS